MPATPGLPLDLGVCSRAFGMECQAATPRTHVLEFGALVLTARAVHASQFNGKQEALAAPAKANLRCPCNGKRRNPFRVPPSSQ